ncbi:MAG: DUF1236 domain-containing protein [Rhodoplanes sp.]
MMIQPRRAMPFICIGAFLTAAALASAQTPAQDSAVGPQIELTPAQRQTIYQSISNTQKNHAAPTGFRVSIGGTVPPGIALSPMPDTLATLIPQVGAFEAAMIEKQVILVDPQTRQVTVVIKGEE